MLAAFLIESVDVRSRVIAAFVPWPASKQRTLKDIEYNLIVFKMGGFERKRK